MTGQLRMPSQANWISDTIYRFRTWCKGHVWTLASLAVYTGVIVWLSACHEIWGDEMRALSLVKDCASLSDVFRALHNEGHPALWHLILYFSYALLRTNLVLKIAAISIAILAAAVFLEKSPFSHIQKAMFLLGLYPIYEYSAISRNYGISMLMLFVFSSLYAERFRRMLAISVTVFFLSQTNLYSLEISICILASLLTEYLYLRWKGGLISVKSNVAITAFLIMVAGILICVMQICPDKSTIVAHPEQALTPMVMARACWCVITQPGLYFMQAFGLSNPLPISILIWGMFLYFVRKPFVVIILMGGIIGIGMIFHAVYHGYPRHQGFAPLLMVAALWMDKSDRTPPGNARVWALRLREGLIYLLLGLEMWAAYVPVRNGILLPYSSSEAVAQFIGQHHEYRDAIIMGEPDFYMEALPYYLENPLYFPREHRFSKVVSLTTNNQQNLSLTELLVTAEQVQKSGRPVLIALGHRLSSDGRSIRIRFNYGKTFEYDLQALKSFNQSTTKIADFQSALTNERYTLYELRTRVP